MILNKFPDPVNEDVLGRAVIVVGDARVAILNVTSVEFFHKFIQTPLYGEVHESSIANKKASRMKGNLLC